MKEIPIHEGKNFLVLNLNPDANDPVVAYKALLSKEYKNPYIQIITPPWPWWTPGIVLVAAVEKAYLNEDPVHMDHWIITPQGHVYRPWEFPLAFADLDRAPANAEEAVGAAKTAIFLNNYGNDRGVTFSVQESGEAKIPPEMAAQFHPPEVQESRGTYTVILSALHHTSPAWGQPGNATVSLFQYRVLVSRGACKILHVSGDPPKAG